MSQKLFEIVYADPPWAYNARNNPKTKFGSGVHGQYPTMTTEEICDLNVTEITAKHAVLFLWSTWPRLPDAMRVIDAWGFTYINLGFLWVKINKDGKPFFSVGYYTKGNSEPCLFAKKGKMKPASNFISQIYRDLQVTVVENRLPHSVKPPGIRDKIVELFGDRFRVELFARDKVAGWHGWGLDYPE